MRRLTLILFLAVFVGMGSLWAQTKTITGTVTGSDDGQPIPGVSIIVKGTTIGTITDTNGKYSLAVPQDATDLIFSFVGMETEDVSIQGRSVIDITLKSEALDIDEVVVTAMGISRQKKALGYAVQDVKGDDLAKVPNDNVLNTLNGRVSGVQVTSTSGAVGASSRITIRGNSSLRSNNQPLFVVDGVPISNATSGAGQWGGQDFGNAVADIDPENIESMTVLKGASAAALYGSRALNGVILITTKKGSAQKKGIGVSYNFNIGFSNIYILPDYQNKYGQGYYGSEYWYKHLGAEDKGLTYQEFAQGDYKWYAGFSYYDGNWGGTMDGMDESWGPRLDIGLKLPQFDSPYTLDADGRPVYEATPWVSQPDNVRDFFTTGINQTHNIALTGGNDKVFGRVAYTYDNTKGVIPNTDLVKHTVNVSTHIQLSKKFSVDANVNYVNNSSDNLPGQGYAVNNVMQSLGSWFGRQVNINNLKDHWQELNPWGNPYNWNSSYHNNPYWTVNNNTTSRVRNRLFGNVLAKWNINDWMNLNFRAGTDFFQERRKHVEHNQSLDYPNGYFWQNKRFNQETNLDLFLNVDKQLGDNWRVSGMLGGNFRQNIYNYTGMTANELTVPNFFDISNVNGNPIADMYTSNRETNSVYAQANISFKDYLFVGATARNDWSSTLPEGEWSYFYPSVNVGLDFTRALGIQSKWFSFGKIRGSYAIVGGDANPYSLNNVYYANTSAFKGITQYYYTRTLANANLKPEKKKSWEVGADLRFINNRIGLDITYYNSKTTDQIMAIQIPTSSGFGNKWINAGELSNKGIETTLYGDIFKNPNGFSWRMTVNWAKNDNQVVSLYGDLESLQIGSSWSGLSVQARPGEEYGVIRGLGYVVDEKTGSYVVGDDGMPLVSQDNKTLGCVTPDWTGGIANDFSWKGLNLHVLIDGRHGGDFFSVTKMFGLYSGILEQTAQDDIRETGVVAGYNALQQYSFVHEDGTPLNNNLEDPNNTDVVSAQSFYENFYGLKEESIIDGSFIKLREISLGYSLPKSMLGNQNVFQSMSLSFYIHNVALLYVDDSNDVKLDPETGYGNGNDGVGFEQYQLPPSRTMGLKLSVSF